MRNVPPKCSDVKEKTDLNDKVLQSLISWRFGGVHVVCKSVTFFWYLACIQHTKSRQLHPYSRAIVGVENINSFPEQSNLFLNNFFIFQLILY